MRAGPSRVAGRGLDVSCVMVDSNGMHEARTTNEFSFRDALATGALRRGTQCRQISIVDSKGSPRFVSSFALTEANARGATMGGVP